MIQMKAVLILSFAIALYVCGCAINPVTGKRQLSLITEKQEIQIGNEQYLPSRQMEGGDYVVDPELTEYVNSIGEKLAAVSDRKLPYEFVVINNSVPNAWALPGGKIAINRGLLLEMNNEAELAAVLGHEIVHAAARHGAMSMERGMLLQGAVMAAGIAASGSTYANLITTGAQLAATLINQKYSRDAELEADYYGMKYMALAGYDPQAAVSLQELFLRLSKESDSDWFSRLFSSHPPTQERVDANRETASKLAVSGDIGIQSYNKGISHLQEKKEAYESYDTAQNALRENNPNEALRLIQNAISVEPNEGLFYALLGDVYFKQHNYNEAINHYDRALGLNNNFFYFYLQRGLVKNELDNPNEAVKDLEKSIELLPTATAFNTLGNISLAQGDQQKAMSYYSEAATSNSEQGKQAARSFVRLDLPGNPNKYLKIGLALSTDKLLVAKITNTTPVHVRIINMRFRYPAAKKQLKESTMGIYEIIAPGKSIILQTGIGPFKKKNAMKYIAAMVSRAEAVD
ncbi:MAG: M48 family metalloprotease [Candidatus Kuenenia sp.]|nr:M48 family metalloprotease [Candidatus Kuenenia hertensis]